MRNLIFILLIVLTSCGTRKTNKTEEKLEVTKKDTTDVTINTGTIDKKIEKENTNTKENSTWDFNSGTMTPINPEKPMTHTDAEGKTNTYTNANVNFGSGSGNKTKETETTRETKTEVRDTSVTKIKIGSTEEIKKTTTKKVTDRKGVGANIWFWIGIAIGTCIVIWFLWFVIIRKRKQK